MRHHAHGQEILIAQGVAAVVVGVDQAEEGGVRVLVLDLGAPVHGLGRDQGGIDQHDAFIRVDEAGRAAAVEGIDKYAWRQFFALAKACDSDACCAASSRHGRLLCTPYML